MISDYPEHNFNGPKSGVKTLRYTASGKEAKKGLILKNSLQHLERA